MLRFASKLLRAAAVIAVGVVVAATPASASDKVVLMLNWFAYGEHAPFYYGLDKGFFAEQGIDLEIQEGRGSGTTIQAVAAGSADFAYADVPTMIRAASKGAPVVAVGVLLQTSPMSVISLAEKNIRTPEDIKGKTVALTPGGSNEQIWPLFLKNTGLKESDFTTAAGDAKVNAVINGKADAVIGYPMNEAIVVKAATGKDVYTIRYADYGIRLVSSGIIAPKSVVESNPDLVRRFMAASVKSVEAAISDPAAAAESILKHSPKASKAELLQEGFNLSVPLYKAPGEDTVHLFRVSDELMAETTKVMFEAGGLDETSRDNPKAFYTNEFLPN